MRPPCAGLRIKRGGSKAYTDAASSAIYDALKENPKVTVMTAAVTHHVAMAMVTAAHLYDVRPGSDDRIGFSDRHRQG